MVRAFRQFNKASALKTLAAAATVPTTSTGGDDATAPPPRRTRNKRGRPPAGGNAGLPFPEEFEAFVGRARPGLNRVLRGMPDALTGTLAMLLRLPGAGGLRCLDGVQVDRLDVCIPPIGHGYVKNAGAVETASKLEHMVVQLERQADDSFTIYWNRCVNDRPRPDALVNTRDR